MKTKFIAAALLWAATVSIVQAQNTTPDRVESSIGTLMYRDGAPSKDTVAKVYD